MASIKKDKWAVPARYYIPAMSDVQITEVKPSRYWKKKNTKKRRKSQWLV